MADVRPSMHGPVNDGSSDEPAFDDEEMRDIKRRRAEADARNVAPSIAVGTPVEQLLPIQRSSTSDPPNVVVRVRDEGADQPRELVVPTENTHGVQIRTLARRLVPGDRELARRMFVMMGEVFEEGCEPLGDQAVDRLLRRPDFWALAAFDGDQIVGGLTAHSLPMTRAERTEIFIYDLAVRPEHQRKGIGRRLVATLRADAARLGIHDVFVPADNEDTHALDFYRAIGGTPSPVTIFTFG